MARKANRVQAIGYLRTSSATNVGQDKDSDKRQKLAIEAYAAGAGVDIVEWYYDAAVKGADAIDSRPGFQAMLDRIAGNGVRLIIVETAGRFARDLMVQEVGFKMLQALGVTLIAADSPDAFVDDGPTATMVRQILGAVAQFEKAMLVAKLRGARERVKAATGKCGGRRSHQEARPDIVAAARAIRKAMPRASLRQIAAELEAAGHVNVNGRAFNHKSVAAMLAD